ncbi:MULTISPECIES: TetR/AcrR family transcriptional regulator [unclassified Haematobacter]|uniref:TetR/AcrR family transcriptional regulator n=1 Tax=unclassified Haematobacter TaxID=2640585 RepID=UPI0025B93E00|nr:MULTISPECIES: TetR/AcrR family transcriptional regulator [unclassified Haematobacter]
MEGFPLNHARGTAKERILYAAEAVRKQGARKMSLDAVAERAGVSKGGLLYHFPSKTRLLEAVVSSHLNRFDSDISARPGLDAADGLLRAYLAEMLHRLAEGAPPASGMLAAAAENPTILGPARHYGRELLERLRANSADPERATMIFLAVQGIWMAQFLGLDLIPREEARVVLERMGTKLT